MKILDERWTGLVATLMFLWAVARQYLPSQLDFFLSNSTSKILSLVYPYVEISFPEYVGDRLKRSEAYDAIQAYLSAFCSSSAARLTAEPDRHGADLVLSMDDYEEVTDEFHGAELWWSSHKSTPRTSSFSLYPAPEERRSYRLTFHRCHRKLVLESYLRYVIEEGVAIEAQKRQRKLYSNTSNFDWHERRKTAWSHVPFEHPATFETLAMEPEKKREIVRDLLGFSRGKEYYARIGRPWKRGYLLHGLPGTGKSTMVAAMANLLDYDVYDLELTAVKNNTALRRLLIETTSKSIVVIEDIDCSLDLSGKRKMKESPEGKSEEEVESKVTLSALLNFIDGLWSSCGGEKIIVFTTNHVEKLDPALIRRGRMDVHVELSYCGFEGFKVLARNYLRIDAHPLFDSIRALLEEKEMTPADVAETLMPKSGSGIDENVEACLVILIKALKECKSRSEKEAATTTVKETEEAKELRNQSE